MGGKSSKSRRVDYIPSGSSVYRYSPYDLPHNERPQPSTKFTRIGDDYNSLEQVTNALRDAGLESSNLIVGIDFTKSNEWMGAISFGHRSLHHLGDSPNPYEQAISIIGRTLSSFDEDNLIPCYGFGDASTHDQEVFSFYNEDRPCDGFKVALDRYKEIVPQLRLAGPTSFAPIIETAIGIVDDSGGQYHVLLIIADGQVTRSVDTNYGQLSPQERSTIDAIVKASKYPLSIVLVGVGDGPWDMMKQFDDNIPSRAFDNFQFVNFTKIMSRSVPTSKKEADFALAALMEIPSQYKATLSLNLLGQRRGTPKRIALPPPLMGNHISASRFPKYYRQTSFEQYSGGSSPAPPYRAEDSSRNRDLCSCRDFPFRILHDLEIFLHGRDLSSSCRLRSVRYVSGAKRTLLSSADIWYVDRLQFNVVSYKVFFVSFLLSANLSTWRNADVLYLWKEPTEMPNLSSAHNSKDTSI
ncbi:E3 ubiquitin-protein ligase RGLG5-like protein [Drosera capensis]